MRARGIPAAVAVAATAAVLLAGCGDRAATPASPSTAGAMTRMAQAGSHPSSTAAMVCGDEIGDAVKRLFGTSAIPPRSHSWSDQLFSCTYAVAAGSLRLSVKDLTEAEPGRTYFDSLRTRLGSPALITGLENLGFPAFETTAGEVAFLKDGKTLLVDASGLSADQLPRGYSRQDTAYSIASAVIGCWTE